VAQPSPQVNSAPTAGADSHGHFIDMAPGRRWLTLRRPMSVGSRSFSVIASCGTHPQTSVFTLRLASGRPARLV
jgi:hypothetical protein